MNYAYLVLVNIIRELGLSELVEGDDDQGHEDVDEEEREDDEVNNVEDGHLSAEPGDRTLVLVRRGHRVLQDAVNTRRKEKSFKISCIYSI